jgi:hypothetical protein
MVYFISLWSFALQHQEGIPHYLVSMMYFIVVILPNVQGIISSLLVLLGISLLFIGVLRFHRKATKAVYSYISLDTVPPSI